VNGYIAHDLGWPLTSVRAGFEVASDPESNHFGWGTDWVLVGFCPRASVALATAGASSLVVATCPVQVRFVLTLRRCLALILVQLKCITFCDERTKGFQTSWILLNFGNAAGVAGTRRRRMTYVSEYVYIRIHESGYHLWLQYIPIVWPHQTTRRVLGRVHITHLISSHLISSKLNWTGSTLCPLRFSFNEQTMFSSVQFSSV